MALLLLAFITCSRETVFGQSYHYQFTLEGVNDPGSAKQVTDPIRLVFNTGENPWKVYPAFNDETDMFDFYADIDVDKTLLEEVLIKEGIVPLDFRKTAMLKETGTATQD